LLQESEGDLRDRNDRLEEFASILSHDLKNPLNVAQGRLELVREECESDHLDGIERSLDRMDTLTENLLDLARHGEGATDTEALGLAAVVDRCWQTIDTGDATLEIDTAATVRADESRLRQLFDNLLHNATEHGSGDDGDPLTVIVGELDDGFYVEDDGVGIPAEHRESVFEMRYSTAEGGTGLGLNIVKEVADDHGWRVRVTEGEAGGARFEITGVEFLDR